MIPTTMVMPLLSKPGKKNAPEGPEFPGLLCGWEFAQEKGPRAKSVALRCPLVSNLAPA